jgi:hypothetical protein
MESWAHGCDGDEGSDLVEAIVEEGINVKDDLVDTAIQEVPH